MKKILIIDYAPAPSRDLSHQLWDRGYDVYIEHEVGRAVAEAQKIQPDLVIIEPAYRGGYDIQTLQSLRTLSPDLKIIVWTAGPDGSDPGDKNCYDAVRRLADHFLPKSRGYSNLLMEIGQLLMS